MSKIQQIANDLYYYNGGDTAHALSQSYWNDGVGTSIKDRLESIVNQRMDEARSHYLYSLKDIQTEDIESAMQLAWTHVRS